MNGPDWLPTRSSATNRNPGGADSRHESLGDLRRCGAGDLCGRQLDACDLTVMADAAVGEATLPQHALGSLDGSEVLGRHRLVVRNARGDAGRGRLVGTGQFEESRQFSHVGLAEPVLSERAQHLVLGGGARSGPVGALGVVGVLSVGHGIELMRGDHLVVDACEQLVLAVKTAVRGVGDVRRVGALGRRHFDDPRPDERRHLVRGSAFVGREAGGDPEDRDDVLHAQRPHGDREQQRRVDAAGVRDAEPRRTAQHCRDLCLALGPGVRQGRGLHPIHAPHPHPRPVSGETSAPATPRCTGDPCHEPQVGGAQPTSRLVGHTAQRRSHARGACGRRCGR